MTSLCSVEESWAHSPVKKEESRQTRYVGEQTNKIQPPGFKGPIGRGVGGVNRQRLFLFSHQIRRRKMKAMRTNGEVECCGWKYV